MLTQLKNLFQYHDLLGIFIWRNFSVRYRQSVLGVLWAVFQPLSLILLFTFVFTKIAPLSTEGYPKPLFFLTGIICWNFFSSSLTYNIPVFNNHLDLVTKIYFPREILPLSMVALAFIDFLITFCILLVLLAKYHFHLSDRVFFTIPLTLLLVMFTIAVSLFFSCINVFYRDLQLASNFLIQLLFFASPVFYSTSFSPIGIRNLLLLNPLAFTIENFRLCLLSDAPINWCAYFYIFMATFVLLVLSYSFFKHMEKKFSDVI